MTSPATVSVLIATLASSERAPYLLRALASLRCQGRVSARPIVIVNGDSADPALVRELERNPDTTLLRRAEPSLPRALAAGCRSVDTEYFAQLDDDDELVPAALEVRLQRMTRADRPDAVISNGIIRNGSHERFSIPDAAAVERDPVAAMLESNWLLPGSALFRAEAVGEDIFAGTPPFLEWTYIGLLLASRHRIALLPEPTVVHYEGHAFSMDRSRDCALGRPLAFAAMLQLDLPPAVKQRLRRKRGAAWHTASDVARLAGDPGAAWSAHLRSLAAPGGWRYATYTRYLLGLGRRRTVLAERREHALADQPDRVRRVVVDAERDLG